MKDAIRQKALELGFDAVGFARAELAPEAGERLKEFLAAGKHGDMGWLEARAQERIQPSHLWAGAKSVVVLGINYGPEHDPMDNLKASERGNISIYARGKDYHDIIKKRLRVLARWMADEFKGEVKLFVDTAPVMEKPLAQRAGLGWQGKHTNVVSREFGSWLFLGEVFTDLDLGETAAHEDLCGACSRCIEVCPTQAITAPYQMDARKCISYLTIEHKGPIPRELRPLMGNRIYGCDDCLAVCPWNKFAKTSGVNEFKRVENDLPSLIELSALDDTAFRKRFSGSSVKRTGRDRFVRNVLVAIGNSGQRALVERVVSLLDDASPLVRGAAVWALSRLDQEEFERRKLRITETDESVRAEWMV